jgi:hypothetical protein
MRALALTLVLCVAAFFAARSVARGSGGSSVAGPVRAVLGAQHAELLSPDSGLLLEAEPASPRVPQKTGGERSSADVERAPEGPELGQFGCVLHGQVRSPRGPFPIQEQAVLSLLRENETRWVRVRADGAYSIAGIEPGAWQVQVFRFGYRKLEGELEFTQEEPVSRRDFELEPGWLLRARVVSPAGESLNGFFVTPTVLTSSRAFLPQFVATEDPPPKSIPEAREGNGYVADGVYHTWDGVATAAGEPILEVLAEPPVYVSLVLGETVLETQVVEAGAEAVTFVFDPESAEGLTATIRLRLVSSVDGAPLAVGEIEVDRNTGYMFRGTEWSQAFPPGEYRFAFQSWGYATQYRTLTFAGGEELDLGDIALEPETRITGRILGAEGRPVRATLEVGKRDDQGRVSYRDGLGFGADREGNFVVFGLERGRYVLHTAVDLELALPRGAEPPAAFVLPNTEVSTLGGSVEGLELRLVRAGFLALRGTDGIAHDSLCKVLDARGELLAYDGFYSGHTPHFALPPGPCTLVLCDAEWKELRRYPFEIGAGITELELGE